MWALVALVVALMVAAGGGSALAAPKGGAKSGKPPRDTSYRMPVWFEWEKSELDVLIVPPGHGQIFNGNGVLGGKEGGAGELTPYENSYLAATEASVADWDEGVKKFGSEALNDKLKTNVYVLGRDDVPQPALREPEIVITSDETKGPILGVAVNTRPCLVDNSKVFVTSFTYADMYNINGQEYGHCLGLDHAEGGPKGDTVIPHDVMNGTYADNPGSAGTHLHCVSNLDVKGLELVFDGQAKPTVATLDPAQYQRIDC